MRLIENAAYFLVRYSLKHLNNVTGAFLELFNLVISDGCAELSHDADYIRGQSLDVHHLLVGLLTNQVHVQDLQDLCPQPIGSWVQE